MSDIVDRLTAHRMLQGIPSGELGWLARHGTLRRYAAGELAMAKGAPIDEMFIQLSGRVVSSVNRASGRRDFLETRGGDVTALLPFSRMTVALGDTHAVEDTEGVAVHRDLFPEMLRECPSLIERLVHLLVDRARHFSSSTLRDEQLQSLGRLAAGLAHELNNPASAALRSAKRLGDALREVGDAAAAFGATPLTPDQRALVAEVGARAQGPANPAVSAVERIDREAALARWLAAHDLDPALQDALAESALTVEALDRLGASAGPHLEVVLRALAADSSASSLAREVEQAAARIHDLVSAAKRFTQLDRAAAPAPMDVARGLADTATMLALKARRKSVAVRLSVDPDLPAVTASDEMNQVWMHLLDNAIDASPDAGEVQVKAGVERNELVVRIIDNGPGIPADVGTRVFEPFFTTKPPGHGAGLGLDIVRRVLAVNQGQVAFLAEPGRTEFRVTIPIAGDIAVPG